MELRHVAILVHLLFALTGAQSVSPCGTDYVAGCLSTAIISACGGISSTSCICGTSGQGAIGSLAGPCLLASCPITEILAIGGLATSACNDWLSTHLLTTARGVANATTTNSIPMSTTFSSATTSNAANMSITISPATPTTSPTTTSTATTSQGLSIGTDIRIGVAVGVVSFVFILGAIFYLCWRRRRSRRQSPPNAYELQISPPIKELPVKPSELDGVHTVEVPRHELDGFEFPFQKQQVEPVEADSQSVRAQSRGRATGTETTAFDFESQKVLITPGLRDHSRGSSRAPPSSYNVDS